MEQGTSEPRACEVCGDPIHRDNKYGICRSKPECARLRDRRRRSLAKAARPEPQRCEVCDSPLASKNKSGICGNHDNPACMKARKQREREADPTPRAHRITIKAGDTFGRWTALEDYSPSRKRILCQCECERATQRRVNGTYLANGRSRSCGCAPRVRRPKPPYLTAGATFGRLTLLEDVANCNDDARFACECGGEITTKAVLVKTGGTRSCGCIRREGRTTHGFSKHPLYPTWNGMVDRCTQPNHPSWHNYGGRADVRITVCERWRTDPWAFAEDIYREIGPRPEGKDENGRALYELDRRDNDGGYWCSRCPECISLQHPFNVQWSTRSQQGINQRKVTKMSAAMAGVIMERDALAVRVAELEELLADCKCGALALSRGALF